MTKKSLDFQFHEIQPVTYRIGDVFIKYLKGNRTEELYMLVKASSVELGRQVNLINLVTGNTWSKAIFVNDVAAVTIPEFDLLSKSNKPATFQRVNQIEITVS